MEQPFQRKAPLPVVSYLFGSHSTKVIFGTLPGESPAKKSSRQPNRFDPCFDLFARFEHFGFERHRQSIGQRNPLVFIRNRRRRGEDTAAVGPNIDRFTRFTVLFAAVLREDLVDLLPTDVEFLKHPIQVHPRSRPAAGIDDEQILLQIPFRVYPDPQISRGRDLQHGQRLSLNAGTQRRPHRRRRQNQLSTPQKTADRHSQFARDIDRHRFTETVQLQFGQ